MTHILSLKCFGVKSFKIHIKVCGWASLLILAVHSYLDTKVTGISDFVFGQDSFGQDLNLLTGIKACISGDLDDLLTFFGSIVGSVSIFMMGPNVNTDFCGFKI